MNVIAQKRINPEEYLKTERASALKNEYFEGQIIPMSGASLIHNRIVSNLIREVGLLLQGSTCEVLSSDMRVTTPFHHSYMYPNATLICEKAQLEDDQFDTLINPAVVFEVLSPGTEDYDRGKKFFFYRQIPSLKEYFLIHTSQPFVEISRRQADSAWQFSQFSSLDDKLEITSAEIKLNVRDIYRT